MGRKKGWRVSGRTAMEERSSAGAPLCLCERLTHLARAKTAARPPGRASRALGKRGTRPPVGAPPPLPTGDKSAAAGRREAADHFGAASVRGQQEGCGCGAWRGGFYAGKGGLSRRPASPLPFPPALVSASRAGARSACAAHGSKTRASVREGRVGERARGGAAATHPAVAGGGAAAREGGGGGDGKQHQGMAQEGKRKRKGEGRVFFRFSGRFFECRVFGVCFWRGGAEEKKNQKDDFAPQALS